MRAATILVALAAAAAQNRPADVEGWDRITWTTTLDQVRVLYPNAKPAADDYGTHLRLGDIRVGDIPLEVTASARKPGSAITLIAMSCHFGLPGAAARVTPNDFDALKTALIRKYGSPRDESHTVEYGDPVHAFLWVFRSSSIELRLTRKRNLPDVGSFRIEYRAATKDVL